MSGGALLAAHASRKGSPAMRGFRAFLMRGNVLDLAVAVIIGAAFTKIVTSLTDDVIMPVIGKATGGLDFANYFLRLGAIPTGFKGDPASYVALKAAGVSMIGYGQFVTAIVQFLILAFVIYLLVRAATRVASPKEADAAGPSEELVVLREIRDALKSQG
jgi:large conductance mechanosensitive channel